MIPGADFTRVSAGCLAVSDSGQLMTVLGYKKNAKKEKVTNSDDEEVEKEVEEDITKGLSLTPNFAQTDSKIWGLYYDRNNKDRQEIIKVEPHTVKPVISFDTEMIK